MNNQIFPRRPKTSDKIVFNCFRGTGFVRNNVTPLSTASCWMLAEASPVKAIIGVATMSFAFSNRRISLVDVRPSITGIDMSRES